jgi:hypothetical protein
MRAGIGLLSLLIAAALIFYISFGGKNGGYEGQVLKQGAVARDEASQLNGKDQNNVRVDESITFDDVMTGNELRGLKVTSVMTGGPMDSAYGLKVGDEITEANQLDLRGSDSGTAKAMVYEGYSRNQHLVVMRDGHEITIAPKNTAFTKARPDLFSSQVPSH